MKKPNALKDKLANSNEPCIGTWSIIPSAMVTDIITQSGLDFFIIDGEHGPINYQIAQAQILACHANQTTPLIRVGQLDYQTVMHALEIGVQGIHCPNIKDLNDIHRFNQLTHYQPIGTRGFSPFCTAHDYSLNNLDLNLNDYNQNITRVIHIETQQALDNIEILLEDKAIDVYFIGLYDLSVLCGFPGKVTHPEVVSLFKKLCHLIHEQQKIVGSITTSLDGLDFMIANQVRYISFSVDCHQLRHSYQPALDALNEAKRKT